MLSGRCFLRGKQVPAGPSQGTLVLFQLFGKESRMFSTSTLPESQGSCTERATAPTVPPPPALHVSKALPLPSLSPAASPKPRSFGVGWDSTACEAAKQQEQMRPPQRVAQKKQDEPPHPSHHPPPAVPGEAEMLQSAGDQRGHGRAANPPTSPGPPQLTPILRVSLGGERTPPPSPRDGK